MALLKMNKPVKNTCMYLNTKGAILGCFFFFNTTMFAFIQFPPKCKHTALKYVGVTSTNIKYARKKIASGCNIHSLLFCRSHSYTFALKLVRKSQEPPS